MVEENIESGLVNAKQQAASSGKEFKDFIYNLRLNDDVLFLIDQEYLEQNQNGLQVIEELQISKNSILVTSRFDELEIIEKCTTLGVKLLPKSMSGNIPITFITD